MGVLTVGDLMNENVVTLAEEESLSLADSVMKLARIRHLPVVNDEDVVVGLVSHRDILKAQVSSLADLSSDRETKLYETISVSEIMCTPVRTVPTDMTVLDAARLMYEHKFGCLPVTKDKRLVGIITESDFVAMVIRALEEEAAIPQSAG